MNTLRKKAEERKRLQQEIKELNDKRQQYIDEEVKKRDSEVKESFNGKVHDLFTRQAKKKNYSAPSKPVF